MKDWIKNSIIYEIYPTSFYDGNGDGIGDFVGIEAKIPYLVDLGINTVWMNPFYKSPFEDGGYDVTDYCAVDEKFGTMEEFESMMRAFKKAGIRVIVDLVIGHTSDKHPWFLESKKRNPNPKYKDWYVWTDNCFRGGPRVMLGVSDRDGGYLVNYYAIQPALNFGYNEITAPWQIHYTDPRLKPLRDEILSIMRFWLEKGVDGFRVDMAQSLVKQDRSGEGCRWLWNILIGETKKLYPDCCFLAEWGNPKAAAACGFDLDYLCHSTPAYNEIFRTDKGENIAEWFEAFGKTYFASHGEGSFQSFASYTADLYKDENVGFSVPTGYHDMIRIADNKSVDVLKGIFAFILTYKCIPQIEYGDEIGIKHNWKLHKDGGYVRTGARTPMQWDNTRYRGFTTAKRAYLPTETAKSRCVESQLADEKSLLNTVKKLISLHKNHPALAFDGSVKVLSVGYPLEYVREKDGEKIYVAINASATPRAVTAPRKIKEVLLAEGAAASGKTVTMKGGSYFIAKL